MFKKNTKHHQPALISAASELPEKQLKLLKGSWAEVFYQEFFGRIDEEIFAVLYSSEPSRPNIAVNVMVGLDVMKAGFGWSDAELYENYCFNLQVRYALGYDRLGDGDFAMRTLYYFRERLSKYYLKSGVNLLEQAFEQVTDAQIQDLRVRTGMQRMDSTQIASNICDTTRLSLLVEVLQRTQRMLDEIDQERYAEAFEPYLKGKAGQYAYRVKADESQTHLERIGVLMHKLVSELADKYGHEQGYQLLKRVFGEHFVLSAESGVRPKAGQELSASSLQSPDDQQASYRRKRGADYVGYVGNVTETCDPQNDLQLIVKVQVEPNTTEDAHMLEEALPELKQRTDLEVMHTDGGYSSEAVDEAMTELEVDQVQTAIKGAKPDPETLGLDGFDWEIQAKGKPQSVTCPNGIQAQVIAGRSRDRYLAYFSLQDCEGCPFAEKCPSEPLGRRPKRALRFSKQQVHVARRRQRSAQAKASGQNLRSAVEATVRSVKHPFRNGKVPVRGQPRVSMLLIGSAAMCNVRRICRYLQHKNKPESQEKTKKSPSSNPVLPFLSLRLRFFSTFLPFSAPRAAVLAFAS
jgi:hypothetical protein